jgi:hypothetical protein
LTDVRVELLIASDTIDDEDLLADRGRYFATRAPAVDGCAARAFAVEGRAVIACGTEDDIFHNAQLPSAPARHRRFSDMALGRKR